MLLDYNSGIWMAHERKPQLEKEFFLFTLPHECLTCVKFCDYVFFSIECKALLRYKVRCSIAHLAKSGIGDRDSINRVLLH